MSAIAISKYDRRYIERHISEFDDDIDFDSMGKEFRAEIETRLGITTHRNRARVKSELYDWRRINEWFVEHRMTNTNFCIIFELHYGRSISVGTVANIRSGHYTGAPMIRLVEELIFGEMIEGESDRRTA